MFPQVEVVTQAYHGEEEMERETDREREEGMGKGEHTGTQPRTVGHNIYLLAHQVS